MRKAAAVLVFFAVIVGTAAIVLQRRQATADVPPWPYVADAVCAETMTSRPPDLVFADQDQLTGVPETLFPGVPWNDLRFRDRRLVRTAGFVHVTANRGVELYASRSTAFMAFRDCYAELNPEDCEFEGTVHLHLKEPWDTSPEVTDRCAVEGRMVTGHDLSVMRLNVWVDPYRPYADLMPLFSEFSDFPDPPPGLTLAQPLDVWSF